MVPGVNNSHVQALLHTPGVAVVPLPDLAKASLSVASKAFEGQLQSWSKQPPEDGYCGFDRFPQKSRMQFRPGHANLGDIGVLQQLAAEVRRACKQTGHLFILLHRACCESLLCIVLTGSTDMRQICTRRAGQASSGPVNASGIVQPNS